MVEQVSKACSGGQPFGDHDPEQSARHGEADGREEIGQGGWNRHQAHLLPDIRAVRAGDIQRSSGNQRHTLRHGDEGGKECDRNGDPEDDGWPPPQQQNEQRRQCNQRHRLSDESDRHEAAHDGWFGDGCNGECEGKQDAGGHTEKCERQSLRKRCQQFGLGGGRGRSEEQILEQPGRCFRDHGWRSHDDKQQPPQKERKRD